MAVSALQRCDTIILGAGMTGAAAGYTSGFPIFEAATAPGGICASYYIQPGSNVRLSGKQANAYHFEVGGGHWIFGGEPAVLQLCDSISPLRRYGRRSSVFFPQQGLLVPYPLQNHLSYLPGEIARAAVSEIRAPIKTNAITLSGWLEQTFGGTLNELFFRPFHEQYTAGLADEIAPQDGYKSPLNIEMVIDGIKSKRPQPVGYNTSFVYPVEGLDALASGLCKTSTINYGFRACHLDLNQRIVSFENGHQLRFERLISTVPLNKTMEMAGLCCMRSDPYTSVLVLNIGGVRGKKCPGEHWIYVSQSRSGFYRIGFYSNVDPFFLPESDQTKVSMYVERAYPGGKRPDKQEVENYTEAVIAELVEWGWLESCTVHDPTFVDVAYTWSYPKSSWKQESLELLEDNGVFQVGRYGRWTFQGIADSIRDGLGIGSRLKLSPTAKTKTETFNLVPKVPTDVPPLISL